MCFMKMRRAFVLICMVAYGCPAPVTAQTSPERVKIAVSSRGVAFIDLYIAQDRGFFREEGLEPELVQVSANVATAALVAGEVDALGAVGLAARASQSGLPIKVLAVTGHRALFWLVSKPEIKSIAELKGMNLGITSRNGSQHLVASRLLAAGGLDVIDPPRSAWIVCGTTMLAATAPARTTASIGRPGRRWKGQ